MSRLARILAVARVETLRLRRDRTSMSLILVVPAVQIVLFGYAVSLEPKHVTLAIARAVPAASQWLDRSITDTGMFTVVADGLAPGVAAHRVATGDASVALELAATDVSAGTALRVVADDSDPAAVRPAVLALQAAMLRNLGQSLPGIGLPGVELRWLYNPQNNPAWAIAPGLAGVVVMISMLMLGALTLVREREQGSWESLLATPVDGFDALAGKLSPYLLLGVLQAIIVISLAHVLFDLPLRGDVAALVLAALLLAAAHLALGFALSALANSQLQAIQGAVFFYLPSMLLSGFMFPPTGMPRWAQVIGEILPLTHYVRAARGVLLRGENAAYVWGQMQGVIIFTLLAGVVAVACYRRRLN